MPIITRVKIFSYYLYVRLSLFFSCKGTIKNENNNGKGMEKWWYGFWLIINMLKNSEVCAMEGIL